MSRNGSGTYTLPAGNPVVSGTTITTTWANTTLTDIANSLTGSVAADGQTPMTGALNMGSNKVSSLATPTVATDAVTKAYADALIGAGSAGVFSSVTDSGLTATRITYATTAGLLTDSANMTFDGTTITSSFNGAHNGTVGATTPSTVKTTALTVTGATSGTLAIAATAIAGTNTATFPAATGIVMVSGNMPAFRAYSSGNFSISTGAYSILPLNTKSFDTNTCYNNTGSTVTLNGVSAPQYSFAPNIAGYYQVNITVGTTAASTTINPTIYKNGSATVYGTVTNGITGYAGGGVVTDLVYMNGTSDYIQAYCYIGSGSFFGASNGTIFSAELVRTS